MFWYGVLKFYNKIFEVDYAFTILCGKNASQLKVKDSDVARYGHGGLLFSRFDFKKFVNCGSASKARYN